MGTVILKEQVVFYKKRRRRPPFLNLKFNQDYNLTDL